MGIDVGQAFEHGKDLKPDQHRVFTAWVDWYVGWLTDRSKRVPFILQGPAGSGKSFTSARAIAACRDIYLRNYPNDYHQNGSPFGLTAWTNEAVTVAREFAQSYNLDIDAMTVMKALGLVLSRERNSKGQKVIESKTHGPRPPYPDWRLATVDEMSTLGDNILPWFTPEMVPTVFMGDLNQLTPVDDKLGEGVGNGFPELPTLSPVANLPGVHAELTEVVRYAGQVLELATAIRREDDLTGKMPDFKAFATPESNLIMIPKGSLRAKAISLFQNPDNKPKVLAWSNKDVDAWNCVLREELKPDWIEPYVVGEQLVAKEQIEDPMSDSVIAATSDYIDVLDVKSKMEDVKFSGEMARVEVIYLHICTPKTTTWVKTIHPDSYDHFLKLIRKRRIQIMNTPDKQRGGLWKTYFDFLATYNLTVKGPSTPSMEKLQLLKRLQYTYALTIHQSQGKTFTHGVGQLINTRKVPFWYVKRLEYTRLTRVSQQMIFGI